jgi:hypothetical protein
MAIGKTSGKSGMYGFGFSRNFTPHEGEKAARDGSPSDVPSSDPLRIPPEHKTLAGLAAVAPESLKQPVVDPVVANTTRVSMSAMAAVEAPSSVQSYTRAADLFMSLVNARSKIARLSDFKDDPVDFDDQFREFCSDPAFLREVSFWLNNRIVRAQFIPNGPIEDGWLFDEDLEKKPEITAPHGLLSVRLRKIDSSDSLVRIGTVKTLHLRRIIIHNMTTRI